MREIKFRGFDGAEWIYHHSIYQDKADKSIWWILNDNDEWLMCSEPQQYTGLKDKNGKEIYEGDVLKDGDIITEVVFRDFSWQEKLISSPHNHRSNSFPFDYEISIVATIIGNVYENPELLEAAE